MTRIAVAWRAERQVVSIHLLQATAKNRTFQRELDKAITLFPPFPTYDCENWMARNIMRAFGGGEIITQPPQSEVAMGDIMMGDQPL